MVRGRRNRGGNKGGAPITIEIGERTVGGYIDLRSGKHKAYRTRFGYWWSLRPVRIAVYVAIELVILGYLAYQHFG